MSFYDCTVFPKIGLGTWGIGGYGTPDSAKSTDEWAESIAYFLSSGGEHIDTAPVYASGYSERIVGRAISLSGVERKKIFLSTKVAAENLAFSDTVESTYSSLERMNIEYIDLLYIHSPNPSIPLEETLRAFSFLRGQGVVKNIGVSNFSRSQLKEAITISAAPIIANQLHYNLIVREPEQDGLIDYCRENAVRIVSWRPLQPITFNHSSDILPLHTRGSYKILDDLADKYDVSTAQISLAWLIGQSDISAVVKSLDKTHIDEILGAQGIKMDAADIERLGNLFPVQLGRSDAIPLANNKLQTSQPSPHN